MNRVSIGYGHLGGNISHSIYCSRKLILSCWLGKYFFSSPFWFSVRVTGVVEMWSIKSQKRPIDRERSE
jgi:hypothetical protein